MDENCSIIVHLPPWVAVTTALVVLQSERVVDATATKKVMKMSMITISHVATTWSMKKSDVLLVLIIIRLADVAEMEWCQEGEIVQFPHHRHVYRDGA